MEGEGDIKEGMVRIEVKLAKEMKKEGWQRIAVKLAKKMRDY